MNEDIEHLKDIIYKLIGGEQRIKICCRSTREEL